MSETRKPPYSVAPPTRNGGGKKSVTHPGAQALGWSVMSMSKAALADLLFDALDLGYGAGSMEGPRHLAQERFVEFAAPRLKARGDRPPKEWSEQ